MTIHRESNKRLYRKRASSEGQNRKTLSSPLPRKTKTTATYRIIVSENDLNISRTDFLQPRIWRKGCIKPGGARQRGSLVRTPILAPHSIRKRNTANMTAPLRSLESEPHAGFPAWGRGACTRKMSCHHTWLEKTMSENFLTLGKKIRHPCPGSIESTKQNESKEMYTKTRYN